MIKVLELFGGIGACSKALERLGIEYEIADYVEIDKYAVASFNAIHGTNYQPQDIKDWDKDIQVDLIMHGSPCQDFSLAGRQAGGDKDSGTRSSLMYETIRIVEKLKPKYVIWENVKNLISKKHIHNFNAYIETLNELGYKSYYKVLNAKDYGIPQNRERIFTISIRNDIDKEFIFPEKIELKNKLKDFLEKDVDESYYLSQKAVDKISYKKNLKEQLCDKLLEENKVKENDVIRHSYSSCRMKKYYPQNSVNNNLAPILDTRCDCLGIAIKNNTKKGYLETSPGDGVYTVTSNKRGTVSKDSIHTLTTRQDYGVVLEDLRIRKLTPKECWRLMGFEDKDFEKASKVNSNTQLYKQAGNSIVVNVLEAILKNLI